MRTVLIPNVILALCVAQALPASGAQDSDYEKELAEARKEMRVAREELKRAAAELARVTREMDPDSPRVRTFEFLSNPRRAVLGVGIAPGAEKNGEVRGVLVTAVTPGSGADRAGLKSGDLLLSVNGANLVTRKGERPGPERKLRDLLDDLAPGDKVEIEYERDGKAATATVTAQRPEALDIGAVMDFDEDMDLLVPRIAGPRKVFIERRPDLKLAKLDSDLGSYFKTTDGVLVVGLPKDGALGLKSGDVIQKIDGEPVDSPIAAMERLRAAGEEEIKLEVLRHGKRETLKGKSPPSRWSERQRIRITDNEP